MADIANFITQNRGRFNRAAIDRQHFGNALLENEVSRLPQANRMQDQQIQAQDIDINDAQRKNAAGVLGRNFSIAAQSPRPRDAARALISSPDFQTAGKLIGLPVDQFTVTDQDTDDTIRQQLQTWAQALDFSRSSAMPAELQTFNAMTKGMPAADVNQARRVNLGLASRAGQGRVTMVNNVPTWTGIGDDGQPFQIPLSSLTSEAGAAGTVKQAEALGGGRGQAQAEREASAPKLAERARQQISVIDNVLTSVDAAASKIDWNTTGFVGNAMKNVAGTAAHDLQQQLLTIQANLGFDRIQQMRESSPTGGALGQVAVQELNALQASVAALAQSQSDQQLRENLAKVKTHYTNWRNVIAQTGQGQGAQGMPDFSQMTDEQLQQIINGQ